MFPSFGEGDPVLGSRQVLGGQPEVDCVRGDLVERELRRELGLERFLAAEHRRRRLADHLDVAHRELEVLRAEVEVVDAQRLLELRRVRLLGDRQHRGAVVVHVVPAHLVRAVREPVGVAVVGRCEQELGRVGGAGRNHHDVGAIGLRGAVVLDLDARDRLAGGVGRQLRRPRVRHQGHVRVLERRPDAEDLGVGLGLDQRREAVARGAPDNLAFNRQWKKADSL